MPFDYWSLDVRAGQPTRFDVLDVELTLLELRGVSAGPGTQATARLRVRWGEEEPREYDGPVPLRFEARGYVFLLDGARDVGSIEIERIAARSMVP